jgi:hypothetical protein
MLQMRGVKGEAVVTYCEPLTSLRQGFDPAGNKGGVVSSCHVVHATIGIENVGFSSKGNRSLVNGAHPLNPIWPY